MLYLWPKNKSSPDNLCVYIHLCVGLSHSCVYVSTEHVYSFNKLLFKKGGFTCIRVLVCVCVCTSHSPNKSSEIMGLLVCASVHNLCGYMWMSLCVSVSHRYMCRTWLGELVPKWTGLFFPSPSPFLQACEASTLKQRHQCVGASPSKMRREWPLSCLRSIFHPPPPFHNLYQSQMRGFVNQLRAWN